MSYEKILTEVYKEELDGALAALSMDMYGKKLAELTVPQVYDVILQETKTLIASKNRISGDKKVYYISAEFLIGKLLTNNLINLGIYDKVKEILKKNGFDLNEVEEVEAEPSLGNGGLGRLASCFLDSISTMGLLGCGIGLNYHYGLFKQVFKNRMQTAEPNEWLSPSSWLHKTSTSFDVHFGDKVVKSVMYDIDIVGYQNGINKLHLFDLEDVDESIVRAGISFDKEDIDKNLTLFLYPDDSDEAGNLLRIYQQYFMVSNAAQLILKEMHEKQYDLHNMSNHAVIQINDTHPTMIILELIRILTQEKAMPMDEAIDIVRSTCAYTNHTILAEALEKWPLEYLEKAVPQLVPIIKELDAMVRDKYDDEKVYIIDDDDVVHMAAIDIHYGFSINGVAALHTEILKSSELKSFYDIYPEKFNNKTNGITFRRWLMSCNPQLSDYITSLIGSKWKKDSSCLERLMDYENDAVVLDTIADIKMQKKRELAAYIKEREGIEIEPYSIYDIQAKRLHEYKRQQMNALYIIHKYLEIRGGKKPVRPITFIFGAKAAPAYVIAQDIIHLILCLSEIINNDPSVNKYMKVVMVENYNVTYAEKLIPACDFSEQISLASKEASGTGNMKFMLNGAVTIGTLDGANVEIHELVGNENMYVFGESADRVIEMYDKGSYKAKKYYEKSPVIKEAVDYITSKNMLKVGNEESLERLKKELIDKDWFMTLLDLEDYIKTKDCAFEEYEDRMNFRRKMLINIAKAGFFSSDRTIAEYNRDIWKVSYDK